MKILENTAANEYWVDRGKFLWEEQLQDVVVKTQMKRDQARKSELEKASSSRSVGRVFGEEEFEKSKKMEGGWG